MIGEVEGEPNVGRLPAAGRQADIERTDRGHLRHLSEELYRIIGHLLNDLAVNPSICAEGQGRYAPRRAEVAGALKRFYCVPDEV